MIITSKTAEIAKLKGLNFNDLPEQSVFQELLFNNYNFFINVRYIVYDSGICNGFYYTIFLVDDTTFTVLGTYGKDLFSGFGTYEECLEFALQHVLIRIK